MTKHELRDNQLRVLWISRIDYEKNSGVKLHSHHDFYQLLFMVDGEGTITINEETFTLRPKHSYFIPMGSEHSFRFIENSTTIDFKFHIESEELIKLLAADELKKPRFISHVAELQALFKLSCSNFHKPQPLLPYRIDVGFKGFLLSILQKNTASEETDKEIFFSTDLELLPDLPIVEYFTEHIQSKITLEEIAKHFNFHPHYLIELFRKKLGTTPMNFLQRLRLEKAKEYLEFTNIPITEIADLIGLSLPYFSRLFRDREGTSPSEYREQTRTVIGKDIVIEQDFLVNLENQPTRFYNQ